MTYADAGAMTPDQLAHALKLGRAAPKLTDVYFGLLDAVARQLGLSRSGLSKWPLADIVRRAARLAGEEPPEWQLRFMLVKWAREEEA